MMHEFTYYVGMEAAALDIANRIRAYGIKTWVEGSTIIVNTTVDRAETIQKLMVYWQGLRDEWWRRDKVHCYENPNTPCMWKRCRSGSARYLKPVLEVYLSKYNRKRKHIRQGKHIEIWR